MTARRTALITGACGGIGTALCTAFRQAGYYVIGTDRRHAEADVDHMEHCDIQEIVGDPARREAMLNALRQAIGPDGLTVLVNNAAVQLLNPTERITVKDLHETLDTNVIGPFLLVQGLLPELERARGSVINIGSVHATATKPGFVAYATSKAALVGLTRALAVDLGGRVRVNAINPGAVSTPLLVAGFDGNEAALRDLERLHPVGRIGRPDEIAAFAVYLASEPAGFISGSALAIDGGIAARLHDPV